MVARPDPADAVGRGVQHHLARDRRVEAAREHHVDAGLELGGGVTEVRGLAARRRGADREGVPQEDRQVLVARPAGVAIRVDVAHQDHRAARVADLRGQLGRLDPLDGLGRPADLQVRVEERQRKAVHGGIDRLVGPGERLVDAPDGDGQDRLELLVDSSGGLHVRPGQDHVGVTVADVEERHAVGGGRELDVGVVRPRGDRVRNALVGERIQQQLEEVEGDRRRGRVGGARQVVARRLHVVRRDLLEPDEVRVDAGDLGRHRRHPRRRVGRLDAPVELRHAHRDHVGVLLIGDQEQVGPEVQVLAHHADRAGGATGIAAGGESEEGEAAQGQGESAHGSKRSGRPGRSAIETAPACVSCTSRGLLGRSGDGLLTLSYPSRAASTSAGWRAVRPVVWWICSRQLVPAATTTASGAARTAGASRSSAMAIDTS